jgi:alkylation response protein AidB-like acyl-CoA dehydrogenase
MMDAGELELFAAGIREVVGGADVDHGVAELGWLDALAADPRTAVSVLFDAQGRAGATSGSLGLVLTAALGSPGSGLVLPRLGGSAVPGRVDGAAVAVDGVVLGSPDDTMLVATDGRSTLASVPCSALAVRTVGGLDPGLGLTELSGTAAVVATSTVGPWEEAVAAGHRALAHELIGASRAMLALARDHAVERVQFDRPIAQFQAVRHRLAEAYVAIEAAEAAVDAAWDDGTPFTAAMAKAIAGRSARTVAKHAQQVLAGIGFTAEHAFHPYLRRTRVLDALLGDTRTLTRELGQSLLDTRQLPPILPL